VKNFATAALLGVATGAATAAGFAVQEIHSPGPAMRMSGAGLVAGYYVAKCTTLSTQPKRTYCYTAPWMYDGRQVSKLAGKFPSNANAKAVAVNDAGEMIGADAAGAWYYANGIVAYVDSAGASSASRLAALNNLGVAVGMSTLAAVYQPVSYRFGGVPAPMLAPGYGVVDVNDAGWVAGWFRNAGGVDQAFVATADGVVAIPALAAGVACRPVRISQVHAVTGKVWLAGNCSGNRPFRYEVRSGTLEELSYAGSSSLGAVSINSSGETAGSAVRPGASAPDGYTALLWSADPATPLDLNANARFAPAGAWNVHATDINETGTVLAGFNDTGGNFFTFLLQPLP
jgi:hypothetical protein